MRFVSTRLGSSRNKRFRLRHLIDDDLVFAQLLFRDAVAGLDHSGFGGGGGRADAGGAGEEAADGDRVGGVVGALVDDFQHVVGAQDRCGYLDAAGAPAIGQRHLPRAERHLVAWDGDGFQQAAADHALGLLVQIGEVVAFHFAVSIAGISVSERMRRTFCSSLWKST